jgi:hypothetical protein
MGIRFKGFFWLTAWILRAASSVTADAAAARPAAVSAKDLAPAAPTIPATVVLRKVAELF